MINVALVEDDPDFLDELAFNLSDEGLSVTCCTDGAALDRELAHQLFDAVVLDLGLPRESGESIVRRLRRDHPRLGIVILSARTMPRDRVKVMEDGADVYMTKPVDMRELALVLRALVRRLRPESPQARQVLTLLTAQNQLITPDGQCIELTVKQTILLARLARATSRQLSRRQIIEAFGYVYMAYDERRLETIVSRLRKKFETAGMSPNTVTAVRGLGYALHMELQERADNEAA